LHQLTTSFNMPTVTVDRDLLFEALGEKFSQVRPTGK
jgi:hypothetical protein